MKTAPFDSLGTAALYKDIHIYNTYIGIYVFLSSPSFSFTVNIMTLKCCGAITCGSRKVIRTPGKKIQNIGSGQRFIHSNFLDLRVAHQMPHGTHRTTRDLHPGVQPCFFQNLAHLVAWFVWFLTCGGLFRQKIGCHH